MDSVQRSRGNLHLAQEIALCAGHIHGASNKDVPLVPAYLLD